MVIEGGIDFCKNYNLIDELIQLWSYGPKSTKKKTVWENGAFDFSNLKSMIPKSNHGHVQKLKNLKACTKVKKLKKKYFQNAQKNGFLFDVVFCLFFNIENDLVRDVSAIRFKAQCNASLFFFF